jgi:hypothetical protein
MEINNSKPHPPLAINNHGDNEGQGDVHVPPFSNERCISVVCACVFMPECIPVVEVGGGGPVAPPSPLPSRLKRLIVSPIHSETLEIHS